MVFEIPFLLARAWVCEYWAMVKPEEGAVHSVKSLGIVHAHGSMTVWSRPILQVGAQECSTLLRPATSHLEDANELFQDLHSYEGCGIFRRQLAGRSRYVLDQSAHAFPRPSSVSCQIDRVVGVSCEEERAHGQRSQWHTVAVHSDGQC